MTADPPKIQTSLGVSTESTISLLGDDLAGEIMGNVGFGELSLWLVLQHRPTRPQVRVFEACLAALADHGFTPTAIAARMTYLSAPESLQGAIAAGLLGGGTRFLGVTENTASFVHAIVESATSHQLSTREGLDELAAAAVSRTRDQHSRLPGFGHPVHKVADPRTARIIEIAAEEDLYGPHLALLEAMGRVHSAILGRSLPINGAGAVGAALADLGFPLKLIRGVSLLARSAGLLGQLAEELERPMAMDTYLYIERNAKYVPPFGDDADAKTER